MNKKVKLTLKAVHGVYVVKQVTNSVEWTPGDTLRQPQVKQLLPRPNLEIVVTEQ